MTEKPELDDRALDALFGAARAEAPLPSVTLLARVEADAARLQRPGPVPDPVPPVWRRLLGALGGWPGMAGLAAAGVAGLAIGLVSPEALDTVRPGFEIAGGAAYGLDDLMPGLGALLDEG